ncbi:MAG: hypothetical protein KJ000_25070 [Pirellulaceae bacterium]|nr:hypothetical protein [Pirellulaceae bacterium]
MAERLLGPRTAPGWMTAETADHRVEFAADVGEVKMVFIDLTILDPRHEQQQEKRLLQRSTKGTRTM